MSRRPPRRSIGGQGVEAGLAAVGFDLARGDVAIVETSRPGPRPFDVVLAQSAWNVLPRPDFLRMSRPYPSAMRRRMVARRAVASFNLRRARRVVSLTESNAEHVRRASGRDVEVAPVWLPLDFTRITPRTGGAPSGRGLVPGTLSWYKNPVAALDVARRRGVEELLFAGSDDGSGCWQDLVYQAEAAGVRVSRSLLSRQEMYDALASSALVVLPSALETLGFGLAEALSLAPNVLASPIPSHREVAARMGAEPLWLPDDGREWPRTAPVSVDADSVYRSWIALGEALGLARRLEAQW
jgi:glycosyltransferase involved in cell wall biosynthesis